MLILSTLTLHSPSRFDFRKITKSAYRSSLSNN